MQTIVNYIANALQARIPRIKIDTANDAATAHLTIPNKHGGKPINILAKAHTGHRGSFLIKLHDFLTRMPKALTSLPLISANI